MICPNCRAQLEPDGRFCGNCGWRLGSESASGELSSEGHPARSQGDRYHGPLATDDTEFVIAAPPDDDDEVTTRASVEVIPNPGPNTGPAASPRIVVTPPPDPYIGKMLGNRFQVEQKLGEGGFGAVYRGTQKGTGRKVALKLLHPDLTQDDNLLKRFQREGVILCGLRDAHTVTTYDFDQTEDGTLFIAMELLEGRSLHTVFNDEAPLRWDRVFRIVRQMCSSLAEAHTQGIVHRDLKPENIYLESRPGNPEFVKILDFGIAKVVQGDGSQQRTQLTANGQTLGTLEYMSPEQLMGKDLDGRSDVYAIGVLAYELMTRALPFPDFKNPAGLITAQLRQIPDPPSVAYPSAGIPPEVDRVILKMLEKDKNDRYHDMTALRAACDDVLTSATMGGGAAAAGPNSSYPSTSSTQPRQAPLGHHPSSHLSEHETEPRAVPGHGSLDSIPPGASGSMYPPGGASGAALPRAPSQGPAGPGPGSSLDALPRAPSHHDPNGPGSSHHSMPPHVPGPVGPVGPAGANGPNPGPAPGYGTMPPTPPANYATPAAGTPYPRAGYAGSSYPPRGVQGAGYSATGSRMWLWIGLAVIAVAGSIGLALALAN